MNKQFDIERIMDNANKFTGMIEITYWTEGTRKTINEDNRFYDTIVLIMDKYKEVELSPILISLWDMIEHNEIIDKNSDWGY